MTGFRSPTTSRFERRRAEGALRVRRAVTAESDIEQRIEEAYIRGVLEGRAAAQGPNSARKSKSGRICGERLKSERERWVADEGNRLGELIVSSLQGIETQLADQVGRILKPFLLEQVRAACHGGIRIGARCAAAEGRVQKDRGFRTRGSHRHAKDARGRPRREHRICSL